MVAGGHGLRGVHVQERVMVERKRGTGTVIIQLLLGLEEHALVIPTKLPYATATHVQVRRIQLGLTNSNHNR